MALIDNLVSYWKLDENSGNRRDWFGTNHLTPTNSPVSAAGKLGSAVSLVAASSQYLSIPDNDSLSTGDSDFTITAWVYLSSKGANRPILQKFSSAAVRDYNLVFNSTSDRFTFTVFDVSGNSIGAAVADNLGSPSLNTWYFIEAYHDSVNNLVGIRINNGTANTTSTGTGVPGDTSAIFTVGANGATPNSFMDGRIDSLGFWKRLFTTTERGQLYNSGAGLDYPFRLAIQGISLVQGSRDFRVQGVSVTLTGSTPNDTPPLITPQQRIRTVKL